jgi:hypothetical protein
VADRCAETYNPETYAARVNLEHIRGVTAEPPFQALGDVLAAHADRVDRGGRQDRNRLALFAEIEALDPLVAMNKAGRSSSPRSRSALRAPTRPIWWAGRHRQPGELGTEMLAFAAAQGDKSPLRGRKIDPANLFSVAEEFQLELADDTADPAIGLLADRGLLRRPGRPARPARRCRPTGPRRLPGPAPAPTRPPRSTRPWPGP